MELYPGVKISIGPPIEDGFYYDFEFPEGVKLSEDDFERIEEKMREHIKADEQFERADVPVGRGARALPRRGPGLQGRADRGPGRSDEGVETVSLYRNGPFTDLCRGPHGPGTKRIKAFKLTSRRRRLLARRRRPPDAHAHLRHRLPRPRRSSRSTSSGSSRRARATTASSAASSTCSCSPSCRPGSPFWLPQRHDDLERADRALARPRTRARLPRRSGRRSSTTSSCGSSRATGTSTATTCTSPTSRTGRWASSR